MSRATSDSTRHRDAEVLSAHAAHGLLLKLEGLRVRRDPEVLHLTLELLELRGQLLLLWDHAHVDVLLVGGGDLLLLLLQHLYLLGEGELLHCAEHVSR